MDKTQGAFTDEFIPIEERNDGKTGTSGPGYQVSDPIGLRNIPFILDYLETHFVFFGSLLSVIGYVVIAAFGSMENIGQYFGYIFFLFLVFIFYSINQKVSFLKGMSSHKWVWVLSLFSFILLLIILVQNLHNIKSKYRAFNYPFIFEIGTTTEIKMPETPISALEFSTTSTSTSVIPE